MLGRVPLWRKMHIVAELNRAVRELALLELRKHCPSEPLECLRRLAAHTYSPLPSVEGEAAS